MRRGSAAAPRWLRLVAAFALVAVPAPAASATDHATEGPGRSSTASERTVVPPTPRAITDPYHSIGREPVTPSVDHDWGAFVTDTSTGEQVAHLVEIDPTDPDLHFEASLSNDTATDLEWLTSQVARVSTEGHRVVAAINGDTWSGYGDVTLSPPQGVHIGHGELMVAGVSARPAFGVTADGSTLIGPVLVTASATVVSGATAGARQAIHRVNQARRPGSVILYTSRFDSHTRTDATGTEVVLGGVPLPLAASGEFLATVEERRTSAGDTPIAPDKVVLSSVSPTGKPFLDHLQVGDTLMLALAITPGWEAATEVVGGRETIVRDGAVLIEPHPAIADEIHPRSAIGVTAEGKIVMATVDGRQPGYSTGARLDELADMMLSRGAVQAINLDGGGSTGLLVRHPGDVEATWANRYSDAQERRVSTALLLVSSAPTGPPTTLLVEPPQARLYPDMAVDFVAKTHDEAYNGVPVMPEDLVWSMEGGGGTLEPSGHFTATGAGTAIVTATVGALSSSAVVTVIDDTVAPIAKAPTTAFIVGSTVTEQTSPVRVSWPAATDDDSSIVRYELRMSTDYGPFVVVPLPMALSRAITLQLAQQQQYRFDVRATDAAGNVGLRARSASLALRAIQQDDPSVVADASWTAKVGTGFMRGSGLISRTPGASLAVPFIGDRIAWVGALGAKRGSAEVWIDGAYDATVEGYATVSTVKRVMYQRSWAISGAHTLEIRPLGVPEGSRVDVDAFLIRGPGAADPVIVGAGDIADCTRTTDSATAAVLDGVVGTVITAGDLAYPRGSAFDFARCYDPTWGIAKARTRPAVGNHEYETSGAAAYFDYFGAAAGSRGRGWYAYDLGSWRVYALNSNCSHVGGCGEGSAQLAWLIHDLAVRPHQCVLAYWHHPRFSSGPHGSNTLTEPFFAALYVAGADVVLNGHDHDYERFAPQTAAGVADPSTGIREFVVGTGGAGLYAFGATFRANSEAHDDATHGVLRLTLGAGTYDWQFLPIAGGTFTDSGSTACH